MAFSEENGHLPASIESLMSLVRANFNTQFGTTYTAENFIGTGAYKNFYTLVQEMQRNEVRTSEIVLKIQDYFRDTNERLRRPAATPQGIIDRFFDEGYEASVKKMILEDAGQLNICVNLDYEFAQVTIGDLTFIAREPGIEGNDITVTLEAGETAGSETIDVNGSDIVVGIQSTVSTADQIKAAIDGDDDASRLIRVVVADGQGSNGQSAETETSLEGGTGEGYPEEKISVCRIIQDLNIGGIITVGSQSESFTISNGQNFDYKFHLPMRYHPWLRLTVTTSENNQIFIESPQTTIQRLRDNITSRYSLGKDFEPQTYFSVVDAPWASQILLEYSLNEGANWTSDVFSSDFDDLFIFELENIFLIED